MPNWRRYENRSTRRAYWQNMQRPTEERLQSWVWEPKNEGRKTAKWAANTNRNRTARRAAEEARARAVPAVGPKKSFFGSWFGRSPSVAPLPPVTATPSSIGAPLPAAPAAAAPLPLSPLAAARAARVAAEQQRAEAKAKRNAVQQVRNTWSKKGSSTVADGPENERGSFWKPSTWFRSKPKAREFVNTTPMNQRRLRLGSRTLRTLGTNATNVTYTAGPATLDLTDYLTVMLDTENEYTEEEKIQRFKHLFLLLEIFEGKRTIQETIAGTQKNVFADPKKSIINFLTGIPGGFRRLFAPVYSSSEQTNLVGKGAQVLQNGVLVLLAIAPLSLAAVLPVTIRAILSKPTILKNVGDLVLLLKDCLDTGKEKNPDAYEAARILTEEGPGALALTRAQKENKDRKEQLEAAITAEVYNRYPDTKEGSEKGKLYAALAYLDSPEYNDTDPADSILDEALERAESANDSDPDPRASAALAAAAAAAADAEELATQLREAEEQIRPIGLSIMPINNFGDLDTALGDLAVAMSKIPLELPTIATNMNLLRAPLIKAWNQGPPGEKMKKMLLLYCVDSVNSYMTRGEELTQEKINELTTVATAEVNTALEAARLASAGKPQMAIQAAMFGAAVAVTKGLKERAAEAAEAAATAQAKPGATQTSIEQAITDAMYPEEAAARLAAEEELATQQAAQASVTAAEQARARSEAAAAAVEAAKLARLVRGGRRRTKRRHRTKRR